MGENWVPRATPFLPKPGSEDACYNMQTACSNMGGAACKQHVSSMQQHVASKQVCECGAVGARVRPRGGGHSGTVSCKKP